MAQKVTQKHLAIKKNAILQSESENLANVKAKFDFKNIEILQNKIYAKKSDIWGEKIALLWKN